MSKETAMKKLLSFIWDIVQTIVIALLIVVPIRYFLFQPFVVKGQSMEPNFENGEYLIVDELSFRFREPKRGEVIVFKYPDNPSQRYIKRIIGLPGEKIEIKDGLIAIYSPTNNKVAEVLNESGYLPGNTFTPGETKFLLGKDEYFVLGDNREFSFDSRRWGAVPKKYIIGRVTVRLWPFAAKIPVPYYGF